MSNELVDEIIKENLDFLESIDSSKYDGLKEGQNPKITLLTCADSRVPTNAIMKDTINNIFSIENIGNQIVTAEGSVDYGVLHLKTPLLVILGHSDCGAIKTCFNDFSKETNGIIKELETLSDGLAETDHNISKDDPQRIGKYIEINVDYQVNHALDKYKDLVESKELTIIGLIMDFNGTYSEKQGKIYLINYNGETTVEKIKEILKLENEDEKIKRIS